MNKKIIKNTVEAYTVLNKEGCPITFYFNTFQNTNELELTITGDYGTFSYNWNSIGNNFKDFLNRIDFEYFAKKMFKNELYLINNTKSLNSFTEEMEKVYLEESKQIPLFETHIVKENHSLTKEYKYLKRILEASFSFEDLQNHIYYSSFDFIYFHYLIENITDYKEVELNENMQEIWELLKSVLNNF